MVNFSSVTDSAPRRSERLIRFRDYRIHEKEKRKIYIYVIISSSICSSYLTRVTITQNTPKKYSSYNYKCHSMHTNNSIIQYIIRINNQVFTINKVNKIKYTVQTKAGLFGYFLVDKCTEIQLFC